MKQKLYLSNPGIATAAGCDAKTFWHSLTSGNNSGLVKTKTFSGENFFAGKINDNEHSPAGAKYEMRVIQIEDLALKQIACFVEQAKKKYGSERIAICVGCCDNGTEFSVAGHREYFATGKFPKNYSLEIQGADYPATFVKEKFELKGPASVFATACSSSGSAIAKGAELITAGIVDAAIVGGVDAASDTALLGFNSLESISAEKTNPFSKNRAGITLGEGAAFFVLAKDSDVVNGGGMENAPIIELLGIGESSDASHMTAPLADGSGALAAMQAALQDAMLEPTQIDYVNLHGTGTKLNDSMEATAMEKCFENNVACSSTKPITGHTLGASSAVELAACYLAIVNDAEKGSAKKLPLHVFDGEYDETIPKLNLVSAKTEFNSPVKICMSNSFGFGGCNVSLIIGKSEEKKMAKNIRELPQTMEREKLIDFLPHKGKMFLLNRLIQHDTEARTLQAETIVTNENIFYDEAAGGIPSYVAFELIAQGVSALGGIIDYKMGRPPHAGFLLSLTNYSANVPYFKTGDSIQIKVKMIEELGEVVTYSGEAYSSKNPNEPAVCATLIAKETYDLQIFKNK